MPPPWIADLAAALAAGHPAALVGIVEVEGSSPREAGAKMVVEEDAVHGSIGGGRLEWEAIALARARLAEAGGDDAPRLHEFLLGPDLGQCCGGHVRLLIEIVRPESLRVAVFGAGHVGRALVRVLAEVPCRIRWIDGREDAFAEPVPAAVTALRADPPDAAVAALPPGTMVVVMTHSHDLDFAIIARALPRADLPFVGLIGSATKRARFLHRLPAAGVAAEAAARLVCPIGLPGVGAKHPGAIAIATAAQILACASRAPAPARSAPASTPYGSR